MKKLITILLLFVICLSVEAQKNKNKTIDDVYATKEEKPSLEEKEQEINNFLIDESKVIWQKVFETPFTFDEIVQKIKEAGMMVNIETTEAKLIGDLKPLKIDYKGAGYSGANTAIIISRSDLLGYVLLEYKENKYRVTVKNMSLCHRYDDPFFKQGELTSMESLSIKKNEFKSPFKKSPSAIFDYTLTKAFTFKNSTDNW